MRYVRIYADADGESHLEDVEVPSEPQSDPTRDLLARVSEPIEAQALIFRQVERESDKGGPHAAPRRQFLIQLPGESEVETSDGDVRRLTAGTIILAEDTHGKGHVTRPLSDGRMTLVVTLPE
jgi:hypothetical protein